eukprot:1139636-Pelagomonas_calceolata.AAC.1
MQQKCSYWCNWRARCQQPLAAGKHPLVGKRQQDKSTGLTQRCSKSAVTGATEEQGINSHQQLVSILG